MTASSPPTNLKELFSFRLNVLAHVSSKVAALLNQQDFDLQPRDWRIIGLLGAFAPMSLQALAREVDVDKSQASRIVSELIERDLLARNADANDGRGVQLSLTSKGKALYRKAFPRAVKRNEMLLSVLTKEERAVLELALDKLSAQAKLMLEEARDSTPRA